MSFKSSFVISQYDMIFVMIWLSIEAQKVHNLF
jgi:hypothetical protein